MNATSIRRALRAMLPGSKAQPRALVLQTLGFEQAQMTTLTAELEQVGPPLGLAPSLDVWGGEVVLADAGFVQRVPPQVLHAFLDERPLLTVESPAGDAFTAGASARQRLEQLSRQLRALAAGDGLPSHAVASTLPPSSGFESQFDSHLQVEQLSESTLDPDRAQLLNTLRRGLVDPAQPPLTAGYGPRAALRVDFASGVAVVDELADQYLRVTHEVPYLSQHVAPGAGAKERPLDQLVWDIGVAAGGFRLLHSPINWWHAPLIAQPRLDVSRFTALPRYREMARCLAVAPISPAELRRRSRVRLNDLRGFLQACLFLGLVHWVPPARS